MRDLTCHLEQLQQHPRNPASKSRFWVPPIKIRSSKFLHTPAGLSKSLLNSYQARACASAFTSPSPMASSTGAGRHVTVVGARSHAALGCAIVSRQRDVLAMERGRDGGRGGCGREEDAVGRRQWAGGQRPGGGNGGDDADGMKGGGRKEPSPRRR